jgi:hypothetical protein
MKRILIFTTMRLRVRRVFDNIRDDVLEATDNRQQPYLYSSLGRKSFFFVQGK